MEIFNENRKQFSQSSGIIRLQYVKDDKKNFARELRRNSTQAEKVMWTHLRNRKLNGLKFRRQQVIKGFIADFYCDEATLAVEIDGGIHNKPEQIKIDEHRNEVFKARGIYTLRFKNKEVMGGIEKCLEKISLVARKRMGERR